jgi:outer membrane murein-binding lipoprotein Lpp
MSSFSRHEVDTLQAQLDVLEQRMEEMREEQRTIPCLSPFLR